VSSIIHNLRNMAMDMNAELESQNDQIDRITLKVIHIIEKGYRKENQGLFHPALHSHLQQLNEF
jgi:hypothetical protein